MNICGKNTKIQPFYAKYHIGRGFSLVEIVVVLSLLLIVSTATITGIGLKSAKTLNEIETLYSDILYLKQLYMSGEKNAYISFKVKENSYILSTDSGSETIKLSGDTTFHQVTGGPIFTFNNKGWTTGGTIIMDTKAYGKNLRYIISIDAITGNVDLIEQEGENEKKG